MSCLFYLYTRDRVPILPKDVEVGKVYIFEVEGEVFWVRVVEELTDGNFLLEEIEPYPYRGVTH